MLFTLFALLWTLLGATTTHAFVAPLTASRSSVAFAPLSASAVKDKEAATDFDLTAYFKAKLPLVEKALDESLVSPEPETDLIVEAMKYSLMAGGKRIRPILCLAAADMFCPDDELRAMPAAVAVEMIHTMSLIHDDLPAMDNDSLRRGKPTCHVVYNEDVAILAGDALLSQSFQHVAANASKDIDPARVVQVVAKLGESVGAKGLAGGQVMDLKCEQKADATLDELRWIHTHKTATLLRVAVGSGAILGGAEPDEVAALEEFALNIGLAFQVQDDILDITQSSEELGKTAGKDEDTDKTTYPKLLGMDGAKEEAQRLIDLAKKSLEPFGDKATPLLALADFIIDRKN